MGSELMPQCGACGSRGTRKVGAETAAPAVGCHCGVIVTGFTEAEATERWERLSRRAEIGAIVERIVANVEHIPDDGRLFIGHGGLSVGIEDDFGEHRHIASASLLDALRALAAEVCGE